MALRPTCDVFGTAKDVEEYVVTISRRRRSDHAVVGTEVIVVDDLCGYRDLGPRAYARFKKGAKKLLVPPPPKKGKDDGEETATAKEKGDVRAADGKKVGR